MYLNVFLKLSSFQYVSKKIVQDILLFDASCARLFFSLTLISTSYIYTHLFMRFLSISMQKLYHDRTGQRHHPDLQGLQLCGPASRSGSHCESLRHCSCSEKNFEPAWQGVPVESRKTFIFQLPQFSWNSRGICASRKIPITDPLTGGRRQKQKG